MAGVTINLNRVDPYKNFKFRIKWNGRYVAGISKVSALTRTTEAILHRVGGDPSPSRKSPCAPSSTPSPWNAASPTTTSSRAGPATSAVGT